MKNGCPQPTVIFKYSLILILGILAVSAVLYGSTLPYLAGGWQGMIVHHRHEGRFEKAAAPVSFTVTAQKDRLINGRFSFPKDGRRIEKGFVGVISQDNRNFYLACTDEAYAFGEMVTPGRISLSLVEGGSAPGAASVDIARGKHVFTDKKEMLSKGAIGLEGFWRGDQQAVGGRGIEKRKTRIICAFPEERGRLLEGTRGWFEGSSRKTRNFSGAASVSRDRFFLADHEGGYTVVDILPKDAVLSYYLKSGKDAKACVTGLGRGRKGESAAGRILKKRRMPRLKGTWQGTARTVAMAGLSTAGAPVEYTIKDQRGRAFFGTKTGAGASEGFYGVTGADNKSLFIAFERKGYAFGELLPGGGLSILYVEAGPDARAVENTLKRAR